MKNRLNLALLTVLFLAAITPATPEVKLPAPIKARYDTLLAAINKGDFETFQSLFGPNFVSVDPAGKVANRAQFLEGAGAMIKSTKKGNLKEKVLGVKAHGRAVSVDFDLAGTILTANGFLKLHEVGTDFWAESKGEWMLVKTVDKVFTVTPVKK